MTRLSTIKRIVIIASIVLLMIFCAIPMIGTIPSGDMGSVSVPVFTKLDSAFDVYAQAMSGTVSCTD